MPQYVVRVWRQNAEPIAKRFEAANIFVARRLARQFLAENGIVLNARMHTRKDMQVPGSYEGGAVFVDLFVPADTRPLG